LYRQIIDLKRKWNIDKIVGLMMLHYFKWPWCLEELTHYVDEIYLLLHYSPQFRAEWPKSVPKVKDFMEINVEVEWEVMEWRKHQGNFRESLLRRLDDVKPELVFFPDEDESFPEPDYLIKDLERFIISKKGQLAFKRCNFWDSMDMVRKDKWVTYHPHVKIW
jgi:glutathione peroxidase-family protein